MLHIDRPYVLNLLRALVAINSVNPSLVPGAPGEREIASYLADVCHQAGLEVTMPEIAPGRINVIARLPGRGGGRTLLLNGHLDTVSVEGMSRPFDPVERDGRLHGRGAYDMKAGVAAMVAAVIAVRNAGVTLAGDAILTMVADEEYVSLGTEALIRQPRADAAIVTEPSDLAVGVANKGFAWVTFETAGRAAHGSRYDEGKDAISAMGRVLRELASLETDRLPQQLHPLLGRPSVHASLIEGGQGLSTYPERCRLQVERRMLPEETVEEVVAEMQGVLQRAGREDPAFAGTAEVFFSRPGYEVAIDTPIVTALASAATRVLGRRPPFAGMWYWTDSALLGRAGIPTVIFGPSGAGAHSAEEYVEVDSVLHCAQVLAETIVEFCRGS